MLKERQKNAKHPIKDISNGSYRDILNEYVMIRLYRLIYILSKWKELDEATQR